MHSQVLLSRFILFINNHEKKIRPRKPKIRKVRLLDNYVFVGGQILFVKPLVHNFAEKARTVMFQNDHNALLQNNNFPQLYQSIHIYKSVLKGIQLNALDIIGV